MAGAQDKPTPRQSFQDHLRVAMKLGTKKPSPDFARKLLTHVRKRGRAVGDVKVGKLYHYAYDPKLKRVLPYYDTLPIVIPIQFYSDGFLGINFHYLDPFNRAALLDKLVHAYEVGKNDRARLRLSYGILKSTTKMHAFFPCLHRYLYSHVRSTFVEVPRDDWAMTVSLPLARFHGAGQGKIWNASMERF